MNNCTQPHIRDGYPNLVSTLPIGTLHDDTVEKSSPAVIGHREFVSAS